MIARSGKIKKSVFLLVFFLLNLIEIFFPSANVLATSLSGPVELKDLVKSSDWIVLARVKKISSSYVLLNDNGIELFQGRHNKVIESAISMEILEAYKGTMDGTFVLHQLGGCVLDHCFNVSLFPNSKFRAGEKVILFLGQVGPDNKQVLFGEIGVLQVDRDDKIKGRGIPLGEFKRTLKEMVSGQ